MVAGEPAPAPHVEGETAVGGRVADGRDYQSQGIRGCSGHALPQPRVQDDIGEGAGSPDGRETDQLAESVASKDRKAAGGRDCCHGRHSGPARLSNWLRFSAGLALAGGRPGQATRRIRDDGQRARGPGRTAGAGSEASLSTQERVLELRDGPLGTEEPDRSPRFRDGDPDRVLPRSSRSSSSSVRASFRRVPGPTWRAARRAARVARAADRA